MNLLALRTEVLGHGFDPIQMSARINQYLNDAQSLVCRRVDYYIEEASQTITTTTGVASYAWPADFARGRSLVDTDTQVELEPVTLRDIDRSSTSQGTPRFYALDGASMHLYPTPDGPHNLLMRYWKLPATLVNDSDTPTIPDGWHRLLWYWACKECYAAEDDPQSSQIWEQQFNVTLAEFAADVKFPSTDTNLQASSMWDSDRGLNAGGWSLYIGS